MCPQNVRHAVDLQELLDHVSSERVSCSSWGKGELVSFRIRIGPYKISHRTLVRYLSKPVDDLDLVDGMDGW